MRERHRRRPREMRGELPERRPLGGPPDQGVLHHPDLGVDRAKLLAEGRDLRDLQPPVFRDHGPALRRDGGLQRLDRFCLSDFIHRVRFPLSLSTGSPCLRGTGEGTIPSTPLVASRRTRGLWQRKFPVRAKSDHFSVSSALKFIRIPGPIVEESERVRMYTPLAPDGFAFMIASKKVRKFSRSFTFPNPTLPIPAWSVAVLSTRNSTFPPFRSRTALAISKVTVPTFGFGISPRGPSSFPLRPTPPLMSGVATALSKSSHPPWIFASRASLPTKSAPASCASFTFSPLANTRARTLFPVPWGSTTEPRTCWSGYFGSTPSRLATSTLSP